MTIAKACRIAGALLAAGALVAACGDSGPAAGAQSDSPVAARLRTAFDLMQKWPGSEVRIGIDAPIDTPVHRIEVYEAIKREEAERRRLDDVD